MKQQKGTLERASKARKRGEAITGMDTMERKKIAKELAWKAKWNAKRAKFNTRARKYS